MYKKFILQDITLLLYIQVVIYRNINIQNIQDSSGVFFAKENQKKWVKNQRKIKVINIACLVNTLFLPLISGKSVYGRAAAVRSQVITNAICTVAHHEPKYTIYHVVIGGLVPGGHSVCLFDYIYTSLPNAIHLINLYIFLAHIVCLFDYISRSF